MSSSYRIIKLKSGDDVITKIKGRENGKVIVETPMIFKSNIVTDFSGIPKEVTILQKWAKYSTNKEVKIPEDYIISYFTPMEEAIHLYKLEKKREQEESRVKKQISPTNPPINNEIIKKLLDDIVDFKEKDPSQDPHMGPPDAIFKFIASEKDLEKLLSKFEIDMEFINEEFFDEMIIPFEEINEDQYTGDDVNHPDYGNRWTDWDSDLTDYFDNN